MKKSKKAVVFFFMSIVLAGCFSAKLLTPTQNDVDRVQQKFPNYTLEQLNQGKMLYEQHCNKCHGLKNPSSRSEEKWKSIVPDMSKKVNKKNSNALNPDAQEKILKYLITMSTAPKVK
jgi:hypothetical protein